MMPAIHPAANPTTTVAEGGLAMYTRRLDLENLLREADPGPPGGEPAAV